MARSEIEVLAESIARNRFLPVPPADRQFVGDGDFLAVGAEFLRHFVEIGGLAPDARVLDLGCGIGRMAVPLTQYLGERGRYLGIDVVEDGIAWCREQIASRYPNFAFLRLDARHPIYNPQGSLAAESVRLPVEDAGIDFAIVVSVFTHLPPSDMLGYAGEIARVLTPAGRCFATFFLMNEEARAGLRRGGARLAFDPEAPGPVHVAQRDNPLAAVGHEEAWLMERLAERGLHPAAPVRHGGWSGREGGASYQDICLLARRPPAAAGSDQRGGQRTP